MILFSGNINYMNAGWNQILSEFLINIAAGWFAAIFITPNFTQGERKTKIIVLIADALLVILCLMGAYRLRYI